MERSRFIRTFVGVRAKEIALGLHERLRKFFLADGIEVREGCRHRGQRHAVGGRNADGATPFDLPFAVEAAQDRFAGAGADPAFIHFLQRAQE